MAKVLLIEDDLVFRRMFNDMILRRFPESLIKQVGSCTTALASINLQPPDLIFMDIKLPDGNGLVLTRGIKKYYPKILIIVLSLSESSEYRAAAKQSGADYFIYKNSLGEDSVRKLIETVFSSFRSSKSQSDHSYG